MIKINLLPFRVARKKENIRKLVSIFLLLIFLTLLSMFWYTLNLNQEILAVKEKTKQVEYQISTYKIKADRVAKIKKDLKILEDKLEIVSSLEKKRKEQLILFDAMTALVVPERMWLESVKVNETSVTIKGIAFDNPTIAEFMEKLENSTIFGKVDLKTAKIKNFKDNIVLKSFELFCNKAIPEEEKQDDSKQGQNAKRKK